MSSQPRIEGKMARGFEVVTQQEWPRSKWLPLLQALRYLKSEGVAAKVKVPLGGIPFPLMQRRAHEYAHRLGMSIRTAGGRQKEPCELFIEFYRPRRSTKNKAD